jgi:subtilisin family serine protease
MRPTVLAVCLSIATLAPGAERDFARDARPGRHVLVTPQQSLTAADRAELEAKGIRLLRPAANGRFLARVAAGASDARIAAVEDIRANDKLHPSVMREIGQGHAWTNVNIYFFDDVQFDDARQSILAAGGALEDLFAVRFAPMNRVKAKIAPASLGALAADDRVLLVTALRGFEPRTHNALSASLSSVDKVHAAPYGLTGAGVSVSLFELAEGQANHVEFQGRNTVFATGGASSDKTHATHVAGTIGAVGARPEAKGMAPGVTISQFCVDASSNTCTTDWLIEKDTKLKARNVIIDNNSWGFVLGWGSASGGYPVWNETADYFGQYDFEFTAPIDEMTIEHGILFVHSAGNDGNGQALGSNGEHRHVRNKNSKDVITDKVFCYSKNGTGTDCGGNCSPGPEYCEITKHQALLGLPYDTLSMTGSAKNAVTVGAVDSAKRALSLSSGGPTKDGRLKPDLVARGGNVFSSAPTDAYATASGTSMAAPVVTGIAALITEQWRKTFNNANPKPHELKALLIAGTDEIGERGPDYQYGYGLVNAKKSVDLVKPAHVNTFSIAQQGQVVEIPITVQTRGDVRVVLQWSDPPIILPDRSTAKVLVNDLDMIVFRQGGASGARARAAHRTAYPWVLDPSRPSRAAGVGANRVDNTEVIDLYGAEPGTYIVRVMGTALVQGPQEATVVTSVPRAN